jgi:hypothetical protein
VAHPNLFGGVPKTALIPTRMETTSNRLGTPPAGWIPCAADTLVCPELCVLPSRLCHTRERGCPALHTPPLPVRGRRPRLPGYCRVLIPMPPNLSCGTPNIVRHPQTCSCGTPKLVWGCSENGSNSYPDGNDLKSTGIDPAPRPAQSRALDQLHSSARKTNPFLTGLL